MENETRFTRFSFLSPKERLREATELIEEELGDEVDLLFVGAESWLLLPTENSGNKGVEVSGVIQKSARDTLINLLADKGIAGFSRTTQVIFYNEEGHEEIGSLRRKS